MDLPGLIESRRHAALPELDASRTYVARMRPGFRVYVIETRSLVVDHRALGRGGTLYRSQPCVAQLTIPLEGRFFDRRASPGPIDRGVAVVSPPGPPDERWEGTPFRALCLEWSNELGARGEHGLVRLGEGRHETFVAIARAVADGSLAPRHLDELFGILGAHGLIDPHATELLHVPAPAAAHKLARAMSTAMSHLPAHPDLADVEVETDLSARHVRRLLHELGPWSPLLGGSFREVLRRHRAWIAPAFATVRGATVERIARALGYRSPNALLLALRSEGVPAPSEARALAAAG